MTNKEMKERYNCFLKRNYKAEEYLNSPERTQGEIEKYLPEYKKVLNSLNWLIVELKKQGVVMSNKQVLEGFE